MGSPWEGGGNVGPLVVNPTFCISSRSRIYLVGGGGGLSFPGFLAFFANNLRPCLAAQRGLVEGFPVADGDAGVLTGITNVYYWVNCGRELGDDYMVQLFLT